MSNANTYIFTISKEQAKAMGLLKKNMIKLRLYDTYS